MPDTFEVCGIKFTDEFEARQVVDEVITGDCYRIRDFPEDCTVIDVGAFYGEFSLACVILKGCHAFAYEPSPITSGILRKNIDANGDKAQKIKVYELGVSNECKKSAFSHWPLHPGGSGFREILDGIQTEVWTRPISDAVAVALELEQPVVVKLDCEGSEKDIFKDESWIDKVQIVTMEWHNNDGNTFRDILRNHGFEVSMEDGTRSGGILFAVKK